MKVSFKTLFAGVLVAGVGAGLASSASAQTPTVSANVPTQKAVKPFTVKLGAVFPTDGDVKNGVGSTWFGFGLNYDIGKTKTESPLVYSAYFDGTFASKSKEGHTNEASAYGIGPAARYYFGAPTQPVNFYAGAGIGAYFLKSKGLDFSQTTTRFGGKLFAGGEFKQGFLGEIAYTFPGNVHGSTLNNFALLVGYRF
jgi:hypothetical protein